MIKKDDPGRCVPDNSTTRARTRRSPRVWKRCGASVKPTEGKRNQLFFTFKPLLSVSVHGPISFSRLGERQRGNAGRERKGGERIFLFLIYTSLCHVDVSFSPHEFIRFCREKEKKEKREGRGERKREEEEEKEKEEEEEEDLFSSSSSSSSTCSFTIGQDILKSKKTKKKRRSRRTRCINRYVDRDPRDR